MLPSNKAIRGKAYIEIISVSLLYFLLFGLLATGVYLALRSWLGVQSVQWPIVVTFVAVSLVPYLVISARVWEVKVTLLGAQADLSLQAHERLERPYYFK